MEQSRFIIGIVLISCATIFKTVVADPDCSSVAVNETELFPYPGNCSLYYDCLNGALTIKQCDDGLWFNEVIQSCDLKENSGCLNTDPRCPKDGSTDYLSHPYDCSKYIECYNKTSFEMSCPANLWFNADEKRCDDPKSSGCKDGSSTTTAPTTTELTTKPTSELTTKTSPFTTPPEVCWGVLPDETVLRPFPGDCNKFYSCEGSLPVEMSCPPHLYFDEKRQLCDWPSEASCDDSTSTTDPNTVTPPYTPTTPDGEDDPRCVDMNITYWPHPEDCTKYIECYRGKGYQMDCPAGLYFDDEDKQCEDPSKSDCGRTTDIPKTTETTTRDPNFSPDPRCDHINDDHYLKPYPGDCTKFIECDGTGFADVVDCPSGLWFNPTLEVCDYPYHAGCEWRKKGFWSYFF